MATTAVPKIQFTETGVVLPQEADILAGVQADQQTAFGGGLNSALETPQGQLASSLTAIIGAKNDDIAELVNQVDPDNADGRFQDAIARIYFLDRLPATPTVVQVDCVGVVGLTIPAGRQVIANDGTIYASTADAVIPPSGTVSVQFEALTTGPIACPIGAINTIYLGVPGWDTANNSTPGIVGSNQESRSDFEFRRRNSVALNAHGSLPSIYANVFDVAGVTDVYAAENVTDSNATLGSLTLVPHSIYIAAVGGAAADIANAIWNKKSTGSNYNGNTTVNVTDSSGYSPPLPTYPVSFQIPPALPVKFAVSIANTAGLPSTIVQDTKNAILAAFAGQDGGPRARIGSTLYASRYYAPVSAIRTGYVEILSLKLGTVTATLDALALDPAYAPTLAASDIAVTLV